MSADCQCRLDRINGQIEELQRAVREKASAVEQENHKFRRAQVGNQYACFSNLMQSQELSQIIAVDSIK